jgi:hypothetical protein
LVSIGLDPFFASPSIADFVAEAVRWRGSRRYQTARAVLTACYLDPILGTYHPVNWNNLIRPFINVPVDDVAMAAALNFYTDFFAECPADRFLFGKGFLHPL